LLCGQFGPALFCCLVCGVDIQLLCEGASYFLVDYTKVHESLMMTILLDRKQYAARDLWAGGFDDYNLLVCFAVVRGFISGV